MAAINTISILKTIKQKMQKFDDKNSQNNLSASKKVSAAITGDYEFEDGDDAAQTTPKKEAYKALEANQAAVNNSPESNQAAPKFEDNLGFDDLDLDNENGFPPQVATNKAEVVANKITNNFDQASLATKEEFFEEEDLENFEGQDYDIDDESLLHHDEEIDNLLAEEHDEEYHVEDNHQEQKEISNNAAKPNDDDLLFDEEEFVDIKKAEAAEELAQKEVAPNKNLKPEEHDDEDNFDFDDLEKELEKDKKDAKKAINFDNLDDVSLDELEENNKQKETSTAATAIKEMPIVGTQVKEETKNKLDEIDLEFEKEFMNYEPKQNNVSASNSKVNEDVKKVTNPVVLKQDDLNDSNWQSQNQKMSPQENNNISRISQMPQQNNGLISEQTLRQTTDSIKKLIDAKNMIGGVSSFTQSPALAEIAINLLEPKLERWLNEHLAQMVEEIVRQEISKIIPK